MVSYGGIIILAAKLFLWALIFSTQLMVNQALASQGM